MLILYLVDLIVSSTFPVRLANAGAVYIRQPLKSVLISDGKNSKKMDKKCRKTLEKGKKKRRRPATSLNMRIRKKKRFAIASTAVPGPPSPAVR